MPVTPQILLLLLLFFPPALPLIKRFVQQMPPAKLCQSSAGSGLIGCHSAAVDVNGRLYTWGVGAAAGHLSVKPVLLPRNGQSCSKTLDISSIYNTSFGYLLSVVARRFAPSCWDGEHVWRGGWPSL